eukprot:9178558-Alexandrium_andersonii.AAC.1
MPFGPGASNRDKASARTFATPGTRARVRRGYANTASPSAISCNTELRAFESAGLFANESRTPLSSERSPMGVRG